MSKCHTYKKRLPPTTNFIEIRAWTEESIVTFINNHPIFNKNNIFNNLLSWFCILNHLQQIRYFFVFPAVLFFYPFILPHQSFCCFLRFRIITQEVVKSYPLWLQCGECLHPTTVAILGYNFRGEIWKISFTYFVFIVLSFATALAFGSRVGYLQGTWEPGSHKILELTGNP